MEGLTRLVTDSLARHGFDRPVDYRRLHWSRWFRCESVRSLLYVPSKPGVFALAEEIIDFGTPQGSATTCDADTHGGNPRRLLAVTQFFEDDDMTYVLDRMLSRENPMRARLGSGRYFVRFVIIEDQTHRRSICHALNQWIASASEKATGIGAHFATSLELTPATEYVPQADEAQANLFESTADVARTSWPATAGATDADVARTVLPATASTTVYPKPAGQSAMPPTSPATAPHLDSGAATNIHCPSPFPSGF